MRLRLLIVIIATALATSGCSFDGEQDGLNEPSTERVFGGPSKEKVFERYEGEWTLEGRTVDPPVEGAKISGGPDISITGHIVRFGSGMLVSELRLCQTRVTEDGIECEAWHHEDIHDPGDMQRADCRLRMNGDKLELHWRVVESGDFSDDPIIASSEYVPPDRQCNADTLTWWIETYARKSGK